MSHVEPGGPAREPSRLAAVAIDLIDAAAAVGVPLRLCGGLGCWMRSSEVTRNVGLIAGRSYSDLDFATFYGHRNRIVELFAARGLRELPATATVPGIRRTMFCSDDRKLHGDVFYDAIDFCHFIDLRSRLAIDNITLPLAELLLQKTQIYELAEKDVIDIQLLLSDHEFGSTDDQEFSVPRIAGLCGSDWGLFRTTLLNLDKVKEFTEQSRLLNHEQRERILVQLERLRHVLFKAPKSLSWRLRSVVGEHLRWYQTVEGSQ